MTHRIPVTAVSIGALTVLAILGAGGTASAAPAFDPNGDGIVTAREVVDAPLVPAAYAPASDLDGDGAISIGEALPALGGCYDAYCFQPPYVKPRPRAIPQQSDPKPPPAPTQIVPVPPAPFRW